MKKNTNIDLIDDKIESELWTVIRLIIKNNNFLFNEMKKLFTFIQISI